MGSPALLVDNLINTRQYTGHTVTALENSTDAPLVAAGRRSTYDAYNSITTNSEAWIKVACGVPRSADMCVVERGNNQGGKTAKVQCSDDDFTTIQDAFNGVTPSGAGAGSLDDAYGVRTPEGVWLKRFSYRSANSWRYDVPALGSGIVATIPGLWIGTSWRPSFVDRPLGIRATRLIVEETQSDQGWIGRGKGVRRREGVLHFTFASMFDAESAVWHLDQYTMGRRMWVIADDERADDAFLAIAPSDLIGQRLDPSYFFPKLDLPYLEADPNG